MLVSIQPLEVAASDEAANHRISHLPVLVLDLHSGCQCKCVMCDIWQRRSSHELPFEMLLRNRGALRSLRVEWVVLTGGEPLMHSRFFDICSLLREEGVRITLLTAGLSLAKHAKEVAYGVDDVIVSLDGPKAIHDEIRGVRGAYDLVAKGVLGLLSRRPEMRIRARTTVQKRNHAYLCDTVGAAQELDLSGISFLAADLSSTAFNRESPSASASQAAVGLSHSEVQVLKCELTRLVAEHRREIASGYIAESPEKLRRIAEHFCAQLGEVPSRAPKCNAPWVSAVVGFDGTVRPCFFHRPIASLLTEALDDALNSNTGLNFRAGLNIEENPTCKQCVCALSRHERKEP